jgi:hypothetical protein
MSLPFILRFQEPCLFLAPDASSSCGVPAGTKTSTAIKAETSDADLFSRDVIPSDAAVSAGTQTMTRIQSESSDQDPQARGFHAIPPVCC